MTSGTYDLFGARSDAAREAERLIRLAAQSGATVMLSGESGTGKGLAARAIHELSSRAGKSFIEVNCPAIPETLLESELFGHVRGAFTGATRDREGRFEAADGGTLFLDEIGEISPATQAKLLRVLQSRAFERVGDTRTRTSDVRLITATNRDLAQFVAEGHFREDLYYRIKVFPIHMPALRDRMGDLPILLEQLTARFRKTTGKRIEGLDDTATRAVEDYCWPGNIRELENAIEFAFVTCQTAIISLGDLPHDIRQFELRRETCAKRAKRADPGRGEITSQVLASPEDLRKVLLECGWNKAQAARRLGVSRTLVWKWMKRHGMPLSQRK